jgi:two-component system sensor histidine kinase/response regulator
MLNLGKTSTQSEPGAERPPRVLIVDDDAINRHLLSAFLFDSGFELIEAASGRDAITSANEKPPDLVLLDVMMPVMDGYETARQLKALAGDAFLPIVLVTALGDTASRVRGFEVGADEFLQKPVNRHELKLRIRNLLQLRSDRRRLSEQNRRLMELQLFREQASSLLIHDLKNPLAVIAMNLSFVEAELGKSEQHADVREAMEDGRIACSRLQRRIAGLLDVAKSQEGHLVLSRSEFNLSTLLRDSCQDFHRVAKDRQLSLTVACPAGLAIVADGDLLRRTVENLLENATRFTPAGGRIEVAAIETPDAIELRVANDGTPISQELREHIFDRFVQGPHQRNLWNQGLGLFFCRLVVLAHGGVIEVAQDASFPTCFRTVLPKHAAASPPTD